MSSDRQGAGNRELLHSIHVLKLTGKQTFDKYFNLTVVITTNNASRHVTVSF